MHDQNLILYQYQTCPFCQKVLRFMQREGIEVELKNTRRDPDARRELIQLGGSSQVPALAIDGRILYESNDIIAWMQANLLEESAAS